MPMIKTLWHYVTVGMVEWALWYAQIRILCILLGSLTPSLWFLVCVQSKYEAQIGRKGKEEGRWLKGLWHYVTAGMVEWALWCAQIQNLCILLGSLAPSLWLLVCVQSKYDAQIGRKGKEECRWLKRCGTMWQQGWSSEPCDMHKYRTCASYLAHLHHPCSCLCPM